MDTEELLLAARRQLSEMASDARGDEPHIPLPYAGDFFQGYEEGFLAGARYAEQKAGEIILNGGW